MPVTVRALLGRLNRKLAAKGERVVAQRGQPRGPRRYYLAHGAHVREVNLETLGRETGCLETWEALQR